MLIIGPVFIRIDLLQVMCYTQQPIIVSPVCSLKLMFTVCAIFFLSWEGAEKVKCLILSYQIMAFNSTLVEKHVPGWQIPHIFPV